MGNGIFSRRVGHLTWIKSAIAGLAYFALVFALGVVLGTVRVLLLLPRIGEVPAVLLEVPVMLAFSWWACALLARRLDVPATPTARLVMGALAFALLMTAEFGLGSWAFGRSVTEQLLRLRETPALIGLAGQLVFATLPLIQLARRRPKRGSATRNGR